MKLARISQLEDQARNGEVFLYQTLVLDGPTFKKRLELQATDIVYKEYGLFDGKSTVFPL